MSISSFALPLSGSRPRRGAAWWLNRQASGHWLALGLLLGAWNAAQDAPPAARRPPALRGYEAVSVRAVQRTQGTP